MQIHIKELSLLARQSGTTPRVLSVSADLRNAQKKKKSVGFIKRYGFVCEITGICQVFLLGT